jgi:negative regulator of sigma-B (phosphoserine phosphatase)
MAELTPAPSSLEWGVAASMPPGESESGDLHLVKSIGSRVLVAVVDGLGRGPEAAAAARAAIDTLERNGESTLPGLLAACHRALAGTRGAVLSLALVDPAAGALTWAGVGNVAGVLLQRGPTGHARGLAARGGIVGGELPRVEPETLALSGDDTLIFATDGINGGFADELPPNDDPKRQAAAILARYGRPNDDALVVVARFVRPRGAP